MARSGLLCRLLSAFFLARHLIVVWLVLSCVLDVILQNEDGTKVEYRVWNPFRSKLAAAILGGVDRIYIVSFLCPLV